jgi:hypothetical protein
MTFADWYNGLDVMDRPQFTDMPNDRGYYRIVYSTDPALWGLSDWRVSSQQSCLVHMVYRTENERACFV